MAKSRCLYPMVSLANVWTLIWSRLFFKEPVTRAKMLGLLLILVGVFFIGLGAEALAGLQTFSTRSRARNS